jgi:hypothetical protein
MRTFGFDIRSTKYAADGTFEGINLQQQLAVSVNQASSRKIVGNVLTNLFAGEVLPYGTIGAGKNIRHGHPFTLHIWWACRPLASSMATNFSE